MKLSDKFPHLKEYYADVNPIPFNKKEYSYNEYLFWKCKFDHLTFKPAREMNRYRNCRSCENIKKTNLNYKESLAYIYPSIASKYSLKNKFSPDSIRPDSILKAKWNDTEEIVRVIDRVLHEIDMGTIKRNHVGKKVLKKRKKNDEIKGKEDIYKIKDSAPLFKDKYPELYNMRTQECSNLTIWSTQSLLWRCNYGHIFSSSIKNLIKRNDKCTICSGSVLVKGVNDALTTIPNVAKCIIFPDPSTITTSYGALVTFKCNKCSYQWDSTLYSRKDNKLKCPACAGKVVIKGFNDLETKIPHITKSWAKENTVSPFEVTAFSEVPVYIYCSKGIDHDLICTYPYVLSRTPKRMTFLCSHCSGSSLEIDMANYISSLGFKIIRADKNILKPKEIDVYVPEKQLAFEFNGVFWHSDLMRENKEYHYQKYMECKKKGIHLIQIWEDDWNNKQEIVKSMISSKLGVLNSRKIPARETLFRKISNLDAKEFLDRYHIQGYADVNYNYGLYHKNKIVSVISFSYVEDEKELIIERYATSSIVQGGFTKILNNALKIEDKDVIKITSFSDNSNSDGSLYKNNGFHLEKELSPDYSYLIKGKRESKSKHGKTNLSNMNRLPRIWDCGKTKWSMFV